uniref:Uncharacterized protein n=1 Tax=Setaria digitata TaxID=48799 RepID=A0A915PX14_9BILA
MPPAGSRVPAALSAPTFVELTLLKEAICENGICEDDRNILGAISGIPFGSPEFGEILATDCVPFDRTRLSTPVDKLEEWLKEIVTGTEVATLVPFTCKVLTDGYGCEVGICVTDTDVGSAKFDEMFAGLEKSISASNETVLDVVAIVGKFISTPEESWAFCTV